MNKVIMKNVCSIFGRIIPVAMTFLIFAIFGCQKQGEETVSLDADNTMTVEKAIDEVNAFLKEIEPVVTRSYGESRRVVSSWVKSLDSGADPSDAKSPKLYIMNFDDSKGFAIVSNDPRKGLLGLSLSGSLEENTVIDNPGLKITLANLETYAKIPTRLDSIAFFEYGPWTNTTFYSPNNGYCPVKWSQGTASGNQFNAYCPTINGQYCKAGCVPVAAAQLMSIYRYPNNYGSYSFDWISMINNSSAQNNSGEFYVGRLMQQLGLSQNINVSYGVSSSSAYTGNIPRTLENFGYSNGGLFQNFTYSHIQEIKNGYPIIIDGRNATSTIGHAWVGHGVLLQTREIRYCKENGDVLEYDYETRELILCNFGWGGTADGFYASGAYCTTVGPEVNDPNLATSSPGSYDFTYQIKGIKGIRN